MKLEELQETQNKISQLLIATGFTSVSKCDISEDNVSIHGITVSEERKDFVQPMIDIFGKENISYLSFDKEVGYYDEEVDADGNVERDDEGKLKSEYVKPGYSHLFFSFRD